MSRTKPLTDEYVQRILDEGVSVLRAKDTPESNFTADLLGKMAQRFKSGNSTPSGAGLGLEEAVRLAEFHINPQ
jgi:hypothetical protein